MLTVKLLNGRNINLDLADCIWDKFPIPGILVKEIKLVNEENGAKWSGSYSQFKKQFFCICKCKSFKEALEGHEIVLHYNCNPTECRIYEFKGVAHCADFNGGWVTEPYTINEQEALELISEADYFYWLESGVKP